MAVGDALVFPGFLTPVLTLLFFPKPPTTFPTCFCRGERQKYARNKVCLNWGSNSQSPGHESDTLTTEPAGWGLKTLYIRDAGSIRRNSLPYNHELTIQKKSLLKTLWGKGENACNQHFLLSHNVFFLIRKRIHHFSQHLFCHLQMIRILTSLKLCHFGKALILWYTTEM